MAGKLMFLVILFMLCLFPMFGEENSPEESPPPIEENQIITEDYIFLPDSAPLLDSSFFDTYPLPVTLAGGGGTLAGIALMVAGILHMGSQAEMGYGSREMNLGIFSLSSGIIITGISSLFLKAGLDALNRK